MENNTAILYINNPKSKNYGDLYRHISEDKYRNLRTGVEGIIAPDKAREIFVIDANATMILNRFPLIETMIKRLELKSDKR